VLRGAAHHLFGVVSIGSYCVEKVLQPLKGTVGFRCNTRCAVKRVNAYSAMKYENTASSEMLYKKVENVFKVNAFENGCEALV